MNVDQTLIMRRLRRKRQKKVASIIAGITSGILAIIIAVAFCLRAVDRFTVTTGEEPELALVSDSDMTRQSTTLVAPPVVGAVDTQYSEIPETVDEGMGSKNTDYYFAYSFYLMGMGEQGTLNYNLAMSLENQTNDIENAMRIMIIRNGGSRIVYSKADDSGAGKPIYSGDKNYPDEKKIIGYTLPFRKNKYIIVETYEIASGEFDKFTIVMWIDGWESVDSMKGGSLSANLKFSTKSINY